MSRLSRLALPLAARVQAMAGAGVPAMPCGAAVSRPTAAALRTARTATLPVLLRARLRVAPEAVDFLLAVLWCADPAAYVAIGPWDLLRRPRSSARSRRGAAAAGLRDAGNEVRDGGLEGLGLPRSLSCAATCTTPYSAAGRAGATSGRAPSPLTSVPCCGSPRPSAARTAPRPFGSSSPVPHFPGRGRPLGGSRPHLPPFWSGSRDSATACGSAHGGPHPRCGRGHHGAPPRGLAETGVL